MSMQVNNNSNGIIKGRGKVATVPCVSFHWNIDSFVIIPGSS